MRVDLPPRFLPAPLRRLAHAAIVLGVVLAIAGAAPLLGRSPGPQWLGMILLGLASPPLAFASLLLFSRSRLEIRQQQLIVRDGVGPLGLSRRFALGSLVDLRIEVLRLGPAGASSAAGAVEAVTILAADTLDRGRRVLLFGYPVAVLEPLIAQVKATPGVCRHSPA